MRPHPVLLRLLVAAWLGAAAVAQGGPGSLDSGGGSGGAGGEGSGDGAVAGSHFTAVGTEFLANPSTSFTQYQPKLALRPDGQRLVVVWASAAGADVYARLFDGQGAPLTGQIAVASTLTSGTQDEPTVAMDENGRFLVAWSDRHGNDGFSMGVFARAFDATGAPLGPEFQVNVTWQQSQWEPFAAARPGGGWVVGFTGTDGGRTYMRLLAADGTPQTGELEVAQFNDKQLDPVPAVARDGTLFFAWIDFNGKAGVGNGTSIFARRFDAFGSALGGEFQVNTTNGGEQREARTAADSKGRFLVVWEDHQADANGIDIHARRFSSAGFALSAEWQVNSTATGDQVRPEVAFDWVGNSVIAWEDRSAGAPKIRAQRYSPQGQPLGAEFFVNPLSADEQSQPDVAVDWAGESFVFAYASLGATLDVYARRFRFSPLSLVGVAAPGSSFGLELDLPGSAGLYRLLLMSLGTSPGLALPDGRVLPLNYDTLFHFVLSTPDGGGAFTGFVGPMPPSATDVATVALPGNPALVGLTLRIAGLTLNLQQPLLADQLVNVTGALPVTIQ